MNVRWKLTLSYAGFLMLAGALLLATVWVFLLRYIPDNVISTGVFVPNRSDLLRAFAPAAIAVLAFLLIFGLLGGWVLAGRMLAPLTKITDATRVAATGTLSHRIRLEGRQDEFRELADAFDTMLARVEAHVAEQQRFAANASHELRTPLATTHLLLDVAQNNPNRDPAKDLARLKETNTRAIELTEALLLLSRAGNIPMDDEMVDLSLLAEEAAETLLPLAEERNVLMDVAGTVVTMAGSSLLLLQVVTNLIHNAIVHNLPSGGRIWVTTIQAADSVSLVVENSGTMLTPDQTATFTEPFQRGAGRTRTGHTGTGLGLAIVSRIVHAHHGTLTLEPRDDGGLRSRIDLPHGLTMGKNEGLTHD